MRLPPGPRLLRSLLDASAAVVALGVLLAAASPPAAAEQAPFVDATAATGLDFLHFLGATGQFDFPEIAGSGGALFDADGDGDLDLFLVQGSMLDPRRAPSDSIFPWRSPEPPSDRLYRNDLGADGRVRWTDVSRTAGFAGERGYGMGVAVGDYDGDGDPDLYVTNFGSNRMWRNQGGLRFEDVTAATRSDDPRWSVPAAFFDADRDGDLDLWVGNYVDFALAKQVPCIGTSGARDYCGPDSYHPESDRMFENRGDGTFRDVTVRAGLAKAAGAALGVVAADFDGDGWLDLYVGNDGDPNFLWINRRDGTFLDEAMPRGCALNGRGQAEASMGVDVADIDGDGDLDLFMTHLNGEHNTLYLNQGGGLFADRSIPSGLGAPSLRHTGFGTAWFDYDNDGVLDVYVANGAVKSLDEQLQEGDPFPFRQRNQLFRGLGGGRFVEIAEPVAGGGGRDEASRGVMAGDLDNDGDVDLVVQNAGAKAQVLLNAVGQDRAWIGIVPVDDGRLVLNARVELRVPGRPPVWREARAVASYASANDPRTLFGLGEASGAVEALVHWPDGAVERWSGLAPRRYHTLGRGSGKAVR